MNIRAVALAIGIAGGLAFGGEVPAAAQTSATLVGISAQELPLGVQALLRPWFRIPV